jgi:hypothetical protein
MTSITFDQFQLVLVFIAVICGVIAAVYFYLSTDIFMSLLKRPLKLIASGMIIMTFGVMLAQVISYESHFGVVFVAYGIPLQAFFYASYIIGSLMILWGARQFASRPTMKVA